jgi:hypothetical protein
MKRSSRKGKFEQTAQPNEAIEPRPEKKYSLEEQFGKALGA